MGFYDESYYEEQEEAAARYYEEWQSQQVEREAAKAALCAACPINGTRCRGGVWCPSRRRMDEQCENCSYWIQCLDPDWCPAESE